MKCDRQIRITDGRVVSDEDFAEERELAEIVEQEKIHRRQNHLSGDTNADGIRNDAKIKHVEIEENE